MFLLLVELHDASGMPIVYHMDKLVSYQAAGDPDEGTLVYTADGRVQRVRETLDEIKDKIAHAIEMVMGPMNPSMAPGPAPRQSDLLVPKTQIKGPLR